MVNEKPVGSVLLDETGTTEDLAWEAAFRVFHARFAPYFYRQEARERSARYLRGLLAPIERKNGWQLAEAVGEADPQGIQRLVRTARWDVDAVRDELLQFVAATFGEADGVFALDETGFLKKGTQSVGVQRQYSGTAGKVENCQLGVFLSYVSSQGHTFLDRRLYLPQGWAEDAVRRQRAGVPEAVAFATKPDLAGAMLQHAVEQGVPGRWVVGDTVYGQDPAFRARIETDLVGLQYVLAVPMTSPLWQEQPVPAASARTGPVRVTRRWSGGTAERVAAALPATVWHRLTVAGGTNGPRVSDWAATRVTVGVPPGARDVAHWLLVRRGVADPTALAYYLSNAPADTPLSTLARVAAARWPIEQCFEEAKGETGLDQYEVRQYVGWYRHVTLSLLAHAFLADLRRHLAPLAPPLPAAFPPGGTDAPP